MSAITTAHKRLYPDAYRKPKRVRENAGSSGARYVNVTPRGQVRVLDQFDAASARAAQTGSDWNVRFLL